MRFPNITHFQTGVAIPVSSLRSRSSCGIGEFPDLVLLGKWCQRTGLDLIQILPVNDTGMDPSPYNARSAFALNPIYVRLEDLPNWQFCSNEIQNARQRFEATERLQYRNVVRFKMKILERLFQRNHAHIVADESLRHWMQENPWLKNYAEFSSKSELFCGWIQFHLERQLKA